MRPKKPRWITCEPGERCFRPQCKTNNELEGVVLSLDEFEVLRLAHLNEYDQGKIARQMKIHQSTISRILTSAHKKVTDALVNIKAIKVEKGCSEVIKQRGRKKC
jgi:uncharacterized protein